MTSSSLINPALIDDLSRRLGTSNLFDWIEARTTELARLGWNKSGYIDLGPKLLAEAGIAECLADIRIPHIATLQAREDGNHIIRHHTFQKQEDQRFWIAHEIAHTFWLQPGSLERALSPQQRTLASDPTLEMLCNRAAAALLVPKGLLNILAKEEGYCIDEDPPPLHLLQKFAKALRVPTRLIARRWFHDILNLPRNIISLKAIKNPKTGVLKGYTIAWEAVSSSFAKLPHRLQGRTVPAYSIPIEFANVTRSVNIDSRWMIFVKQARGESQRSIPFSKLPSGNTIPALVAKAGQESLVSFLG